MSKTSLATPMTAILFVRPSLFSFVIAVVSAVNGAIDNNSILRVSAPCTSSGLMAFKISVGAVATATIIGVASAKPILKLYANGLVFLLVPIGNAALSIDPGTIAIDNIIINAMYSIPVGIASLTR